MICTACDRPISADTGLERFETFHPGCLAITLQGETPKPAGQAHRPALNPRRGDDTSRVVGFLRGSDGD
jgi:hypothetical protein